MSIGMLAVLSDIHGNLPALEAVVADAEAQGATRFVNLGDILSGPLWPRETAEWLMKRNWPTIAGNHERQVLTGNPGRMGASDAFAKARLDQRHLAWMASHPPTMDLGEGVLACHGSPSSDVVHLLYALEGGTLVAAGEDVVADRLRPGRHDLVLCGHSHLAGLVTLADGTRVLNPGSVGLQAYDDDHPSPYRVEVGDPLARYALLDGATITFRAVAYDHASASTRARASGQAGWAHALATGRMPA